jgi:hypothetical protein
MKGTPKAIRHTHSGTWLQSSINNFFFFCRNSPQWARASSFTRFLDHTQRCTTVGRTPLDELVVEHPQHTDIHAPGVLRTHNLSRPAAADLRLRPRGHWDRQSITIGTAICYDSGIHYVWGSARTLHLCQAAKSSYYESLRLTGHNPTVMQLLISVILSIEIHFILLPWLHCLHDPLRDGFSHLASRQELQNLGQAAVDVWLAWQQSKLFNFSALLRQMPECTSQRRGTVRTLPN